MNEHLTPEPDATSAPAIDQVADDLDGESNGSVMSDQAQRVIRWIRRHPESTLSEIRLGTGLTHAAVDNQIAALHTQGAVSTHDGLTYTLNVARLVALVHGVAAHIGIIKPYR